MIWILIISMGVLTYAIRISFLLALGKVTLSLRLLAILRFVPITVLSAIIVPQLVHPGASFDFTLANPRWLAGIVAIFVAWRTRNVLLTIMVGMVLLWLLQLILH